MCPRLALDWAFLGVQGAGGSCSFWLAWPIPFPGGLSHLHVPCQQSRPSQQAACLPPLLAKFGSLRSAAVSGSQSHGGPYLIWFPAPPPDPQGRASPERVPAHTVPCACSAPTMFLVLVATEELKEFFAKARAGSVRLIKVVIEDGECFLWVRGQAGCWTLLLLWEVGGTLSFSPSGPQFPIWK